jgi:cephalosporin hydroxylase
LDDTFQREQREDVRRLGESAELRRRSMRWIADVSRHRYSHHFTWLARPIIQFPQDIVALQEIIWEVRPGLIVETGIAHGGSLIFSASMLELLGGDRLVVGVDIDIRAHNRDEIERHPLYGRVRMIEGSSVDPQVFAQVEAEADGRDPVIVILDSNHTHDHVLRELELYSRLVGRGGYIVVCDTVIEEMPDDLFPDRPWGRGNNPRTAVRQFLETTDRFEVAGEIDAKLLITVAPGGHLRCIKD